MSLSHDLNRNSQGGAPRPVEVIDSALTREADNWAERFAARTSLARGAITTAIYLFAALASLIYAVRTGQLLFLGVAVLAYAGSVPGKQRGSLVEEIQLEAAGLPRHTMYYLNVFMVGLGLFGIFSSVVVLAFGLAVPAALSFGFNSLAGGVAITALKIGDYIARTNPSHPTGGHRARGQQGAARLMGAPAARAITVPVPVPGSSR